MSGAVFTVVLTLVILFFVALTLNMVLKGVKKKQIRSEQDARVRFPNAKWIDSGANFFGQESRGARQTRGNGTLVLTDTELYFEKWLPHHEYRIPLAKVVEIANPTSFLGKTYFRPLLKVVFTNEQGKQDSMAWFVQDLEQMERAIQEALHLIGKAGRKTDAQ